MTVSIDRAAPKSSAAAHAAVTLNHYKHWCAWHAHTTAASAAAGGWGRMNRAVIVFIMIQTGAVHFKDAVWAHIQTEIGKPEMGLRGAEVFWCERVYLLDVTFVKQPGYNFLFLWLIIALWSALLLLLCAVLPKCSSPVIGHKSNQTSLCFYSLRRKLWVRLRFRSCTWNKVRTHTGRSSEFSPWIHLDVSGCGGLTDLSLASTVDVVCTFNSSYVLIVFT